MRTPSECTLRPQIAGLHRKGSDPELDMTKFSCSQQATIEEEDSRQHIRTNMLSLSNTISSRDNKGRLKLTNTG